MCIGELFNNEQKLIQKCPRRYLNILESRISLISPEIQLPPPPPPNSLNIIVLPESY